MFPLSPAKSRLETLAKLEHPHKTHIEQSQLPSSLGYVLSGSRDLLESLCRYRCSTATDS